MDGDGGHELERLRQLLFFSFMWMNVRSVVYRMSLFMEANACECGRVLCSAHRVRYHADEIRTTY